MLGLTAIVTLAFAACGDNLFGPDPTEVTFAASLGIDLANMTLTGTGLYIRDDAVGDGAVAAAGDIATVTFSGWLVDGTLFDSGPFQFMIGPTGAIAGFVEATRAHRTLRTRFWSRCSSRSGRVVKKRGGNAWTRPPRRFGQATGRTRRTDSVD